MKFTELESIMFSKGVSSLAELARALDTTPQAVSNWKARDQVPYHVINKVKNINEYKSTDNVIASHDIHLPDILIIIAEQIKIILFVPFITCFLTFTYVQFLKQPLYQSWATIIIPEKKISSGGGLAGLASQFGVSMPQTYEVDLSSPSIFPELLRSRTFAEKLLKKSFYTEKFGRDLSLLSILNNGLVPSSKDEELLTIEAIQKLKKDYLIFDKNPKTNFSTIKVIAPEPKFAKELTDAVIYELESLNRYFKTVRVRDKNKFIENRISSVESQLKESEQRLKKFNEENRQISSPSLQLNLDRLEREVEVQKGIFLTLKQQLELSKIEEIQETSIIHILDKPYIAISPFNKNLVSNTILSGLVGVMLGILIGFIRSYTKSDIERRKKLKRVRNFIYKKGSDIFQDPRISGSIFAVFLVTAPIYFGYKSTAPSFFGMYSLKILILNSIHIFILIFSASLFIKYAVRNRGERKK